MSVYFIEGKEEDNQMGPFGYQLRERIDLQARDYRTRMQRSISPLEEREREGEELQVRIGMHRTRSPLRERRGRVEGRIQYCLFGLSIRLRIIKENDCLIMRTR